MTTAPDGGQGGHAHRCRTASGFGEALLAATAGCLREHADAPTTQRA